MIVGRTGSGKTVAWRTLTRALAALKESHPNDERYQRVHPHILNPLALSNDEIYGCDSDDVEMCGFTNLYCFLTWALPKLLHK